MWPKANFTEKKGHIPKTYQNVIHLGKWVTPLPAQFLGTVGRVNVQLKYPDFGRFVDYLIITGNSAILTGVQVLLYGFVFVIVK